MSSLANILALLPLALAASPLAMNFDRPMIFKETDFAMNNGRRGIEIPSDGNCMNLDSVPEFRTNIGSIYVPCPSDTAMDLMCTMYSDNSCGDEMFTFTRPHAHLFRQTAGDDVGSHVRSIKCMPVSSPVVRQGHIFTSNRPSTKSPSNCANDSCTSDMNCQAMNPNYNLYCSMDLMTCQHRSQIGGLCSGNSGNFRCQAGTCVGGVCMETGENLPCSQGVDCPSGFECRPYRSMDVLGVSTVQTVCMKTEDVRGTPCPCAEHMSCSLRSGDNLYCEWDGTCALTTMKCQSDSQCCSGNCNAQACQ